ncbi:hypothetical protein ASE37_06575 [Rhizobium sp. Root268]|nr:hypothetical protein ASC86_06575 [Rhizobium sp. Root1212]KRD38599.1 hypothetical protein ASE37_06575 [Rhizobium sp. Root268]
MYERLIKAFFQTAHLRAVSSSETALHARLFPGAQATGRIYPEKFKQDIRRDTRCVYFQRAELFADRLCGHMRVSWPHHEISEGIFEKTAAPDGKWRKATKKRPHREGVFF